MLYLTGSLPKSEANLAILHSLPVGFLATPFSGYSLEKAAGWLWAADNGCFSARWTPEPWLAWLDRMVPLRHDCAFAVVPDVVGDHDGTLTRWGEWRHEVAGRGYIPAFVAQDGCTPPDLPADAGALFIGGSTEFKLSNSARDITAEAVGRGIWVHMGRVNSRKRFQLAKSWGCDSADGTFLAFGPDTNTPRLARWF